MFNNKYDYYIQFPLPLTFQLIIHTWLFYKSRFTQRKQRAFWDLIF